MSPHHRATAVGHAAIELTLIGVTALCVADIHCR
ncbi:Ms4533A family Cys-rich leader peptide [Streptomyces odonnellii]